MFFFFKFISYQEILIFIQKFLICCLIFTSEFPCQIFAKRNLQFQAKVPSSCCPKEFHQFFFYLGHPFLRKKKPAIGLRIYRKVMYYIDIQNSKKNYSVSLFLSRSRHTLRYFFPGETVKIHILAARQKVVRKIIKIFFALCRSSKNKKKDGRENRCLSRKKFLREKMSIVLTYQVKTLRSTFLVAFFFRQAYNSQVKWRVRKKIKTFNLGSKKLISHKKLKVYIYIGIFISRKVAEEGLGLQITI